MTTERVLIQPSRLRISLPGYSVRTASLDQLSFDSDFALVGQVISGQSVVGNHSFGDSPVVVSFGRDFGVPPIFILGGWLGGITTNPFHMTAVDNYVSERDYDGYFNVVVEATQATITGGQGVVIGDPGTSGQPGSEGFLWREYLCKWKALI